MAGMNNARRKFIKQSAWAGLGLAWGGDVPFLDGASRKATETQGLNAFPIIDIHQHTDYSGRTNSELLAHQKTMGISKTILLPSWRPGDGKTGRERWPTTGNEACYRLAQQYPDQFFFGANELPGTPDTRREIEKYLKLGARVIGELKYPLACDAPEMQQLYQIAQEYEVPVYMHWQHNSYNFGFERFHKMLEKYPKVNFIGHAQTWWANIDKNYKDPTNLYPKGKVTYGGLTERLLSDYPNMLSDLSAGSGLNALLRDEAFTREFLERHQDKLIYGSDCSDAVGTGKECQGAQTLAAIRRLAPNKDIERKLLYKNAKRLFRL